MSSLLSVLACLLIGSELLLTRTAAVSGVVEVLLADVVLETLETLIKQNMQIILSRAASFWPLSMELAIIFGILVIVWLRV